MNWWEADFDKLQGSDELQRLTGLWLELKYACLVFHFPVNLLYLSYVLAKRSGKESIKYELTGGVVLQLTLSDVAKVLFHVEESEEPFSVVLVVDGKEQEVVATPVKVPPCNGTHARES